MTAADWTKRREQIDTAIRFVLTYWQPFALGALVLVVGGMIAAYGRKEREAGMWQEKFRVADSIVAKKSPLVTIYDTRIVHDTLKLNRLITRLDSIRDTMRIHDTIWVKQFVAQAESTAKACSETATDCLAFRENATAVMHAQATEITALKKMPHRGPCGLDVTLGPAVARTTDGWRVAPFSVTAGIGCRF